MRLRQRNEHVPGTHARTEAYGHEVCSPAVDAARYAGDVLLQNEPNGPGFFGPRYRAAADLVRLYATATRACGRRERRSGD